MVVVGTSGVDCPSVHRVLQYDHGGRGIPVDSEPVRAVQDHAPAVAAVQIGNRAASLNPARVAGYGDHVLEDHVLGQEVEEVLTVDEARQPLPDDPEERVQRCEVGDVVNGHGHPATGEVQAWTLRRAKSWKVAAGGR